MYKYTEMQKFGNVKLILEDGTQFTGRSFGYEKSVSGEIVFNTAMTGYPESLTDPSYKGQLLVSTYPLIGNYGVPEDNFSDGVSDYFESDKIQVSALIISDYSFEYSHWNAKKSLGHWLKVNQIPGIYGIDTRMLTQLIREKGSMLGKIIINDKDTELDDPNQRNLVAKVSCTERKEYGNGKYRILLLDCGVKNNIIRCFKKRDTTVIQVPWDHDIGKEKFDGLFISNGPGNPKMCDVTISSLKHVIQNNNPVFGICLGAQLIALASGAKTYKLKYGHRSHNQPVKYVSNNKCFITSQNHGYAIKMETLGEKWEPMFINLNDATCEGIRHKTKPFFAVQFHPEASGGPTDTEFLFDEFIELIKIYKAK